MSENLVKAKEAVLWGCKVMCERGYALGTVGNISARVKGTDLFVITPSSTPYDTLTPDDLVVGNMEGEIVEGTKRPSIEFSMHRNIFRRRPDVDAIIHTHSTYATAAGSIDGVDTIPAIDIETAGYLGGDIVVAPFAPPGSEELAKNVEEGIGDKGGVILASHGAIGVGTTMQAAMLASDNVERTCQMYLAISAAGKVRILPESYLKSSHEASLKKRGVI